MKKAVKTSAKKARRARKLKKSDEDFFKVIGSKGGRATMKNRGSEYFANIARISHERRRQRAALERLTD